VAPECRRCARCRSGSVPHDHWKTRDHESPLARPPIASRCGNVLIFTRAIEPVYFDNRKSGRASSRQLTPVHTRPICFGYRRSFRYAKVRAPGESVKIGRQDQRSSAISTSNQDTILVRGHDLARELIGTIGFTDHIWLLITGALPSTAQRRVLDGTLVAIAEHGLVPSVQASRMTLAAAPEALQGAVAAGILGCGSVVLGSAEAAGRFLAEISAAVAGGVSIEAQQPASSASTVRPSGLFQVMVIRYTRAPIPARAACCSLVSRPVPRAATPRLRRQWKSCCLP